MIRMDWFAGASWVTSLAVIGQANLNEEFVNWLVKAIVAGAIAITGYYLRDTAKTIKDTKKQADDLRAIIDDHDAIISLWIESLGKELDAREGSIGRRHTDKALANLLTAFRRINERNGDREEKQ